VSTTDAAAPPLGAREVVEAMLDAELARDWERWRQLLAPDVIVDHPDAPPLVGIAENLAFVRRFSDAVDDYERHLFDIVADDDAAAFRFSLTGVLARPLGERPPRPEPFEIAGAAFVTTWGGRVVRIVEIITTNTLRGG
jgi:ketosteroid isomerase-like protein